MLLDIDTVWCPDCMTFHNPEDLIKLDFTEELDEYRCHKSAPMNSTLMNARKENK